ncbi:uncharacterized protein LOC123664952, partial [Melitaea cinxia]|uniref:uncharacterized protein LOC123664952 n=1 Tax=Melitaea cinxia TaxID=113334 RepID=UPI001E271E03
IADSFCLTCKKYLKLNQVSEHIIEPDHQKSFQSSDYVVKYKEDSIRKVEVGYYCEMCNVMMQNLARVGIHIYETTHVDNKIKQQLKESDAGVIVFDDILIENNAWNGMANGSCFLCNVDYSNADDHRNEPAHILKLIQSKFELLKDKFIYRKIDDDSINCLICNTIFMEIFKETHTNESEHQKNYIKCQMTKESKTKTGNCYNNNNNIDKDIKESDTSNDAVAESIDTKNDPVKSEELTSDISKTQIVVFNKNVVEEAENKNEDELLPPAEAIKRAMKFAKDNGLKYKRNSTYCNLCDVQMSSSLKMMKEHVAESLHKEKALNKTTRKMNKVPLGCFVENITTVKSPFVNDIVINDEICIEKQSFLLIGIHNGVLKCQVCEVNLNFGNIDEHLHEHKHTKAMDTMNVLTDFDSEFVREVRPRVYHCGYCNFIEASLNSLKSHLKSINHLTKKNQAKIRLGSHLHAMAEDRRRREFLNFMGMFNLPFFH